MPYFDPAFHEPMFCIGCGRIGPEHVERLKLTPMKVEPQGFTKWLRACPSCYDAGVRLVGDVVPGVFSFKGRAPGQSLGAVPVTA